MKIVLNRPPSEPSRPHPLERWCSDHARHDHVACETLINRLEERVRQRRAFGYEELMRGIRIAPAAVANTTVPPGLLLTLPPIRSDVAAIVDDFLIYLSAATWRDNRVLIGAALVDPTHRFRAPPSLRRWAKRVGICPARSPEQEEVFWLDALNRLHAFYGNAIDDQARSGVAGVRRYTGRLHFDDKQNSYIDCAALIERSDGLRLAGAVQWGNERYELDAPLASLGASRYRTIAPVHCVSAVSRIPHPARSLLTMEFTSRTDSQLCVEGTWTESGEDAAFSGELDRVL